MNKDEIKNRLAKAVKESEYRPDIKSLSIFGSYVTGEAKERSDVDVLIDFTENSHVGFFEYVRIRRKLSEVLGCEVDMVTVQGLSKYIKNQVLRQADAVVRQLEIIGEAAAKLHKNFCNIHSEIPFRTTIHHLLVFSARFSCCHFSKCFNINGLCRHQNGREFLSFGFNALRR